MTTRPRVLISGPGGAGGGVVMVIDHIFASALAQRFELVRFISNDPRYHRHSPPARVANTLLSRALGFDGSFNLSARGLVAAWCKALECRPDLVHVHSSHGWDFWIAIRMIRAAQRRGAVAIHHVHGNFDVYYPRWSSVRRAAFRRVLQVPDRFVVLSRSWESWFSRHLDPARIEVLYNCVDVHRFPPRVDAPPRDEVRLLFVGTRDPDIKGAYDLLAVAPAVVRQAPNVRFVFVGKDTGRLEERFVRGTPLERHVEFKGFRTVGEIVADFEAADVLLLPSHMEAMPMALLEGMAAGLPVLASGISSIPEIVEEPAGGVLIRPGDREALERGILALVADGAWRRRAGAANRRLAEERFDRPRFADELARIYEDTLRLRGRAPSSERS